jgi:hypothetical protein
MSLRDELISGLKKKAVPLVPVNIEGLPTFYTRGLTVGQTRAAISAPEEQGTIQERMARDAFYLDRRIARVILDENGAPVFDSKSDADMQELRAVMEQVPPDLHQKIVTAADAVNAPGGDEVAGPN